MYNPLRPNRYTEVKVAAYRQARGPPPTPSNFLSAALLSAQSSAPPMEDSWAPASFLKVPQPQLPATAALSMSAEELHQQRIQRSAALGVQRAVEYQKDAMETAFKARRLEGADTRSRVTAKLSELMAAKAPPPTPSGAGPSGASPPPPPAATLAFRRSGLRTGGFIMAAVAPHGAAPRRLEGTPSAALLLRFAGTPSLWDGLEPAARSPIEAARSNPEAASRLAAEAFAGLRRDLLRECAPFGSVSSTRIRLLSASEETDVRQRLRTAFPEATEDRIDAAVRAEIVRVFIRFDAMAGAFKAAENISARAAAWRVDFFPAADFDAGELGPRDVEGYARAPEP